MTRDEFMDKLEGELAARRVPELPYWCGVLHGLARLGLVPISTKVFARLLLKAGENFNSSLTSAGALPGGGRIQTSSGGPRGWGGCRPR